MGEDQRGAAMAYKIVGPLCLQGLFPTSWRRVHSGTFLAFFFKVPYNKK